MEQQHSVIKSLSTSFRPTGHEVDSYKRIRLTSLLQKTQEAAEAHATLYNCGYQILIQQNIVWVLSRMQLEIKRMPEWDEPVRIETWHKRVERIFALRDFLLFDAHDEPIIKATSAWLLMDIHTRRMLRVEHVLPLLAHVNIPQDAIPDVPGKLMVPEGELLSLKQRHSVVYSDIDLINHVTNTKYVEWALDLLPIAGSHPGMHTMTSFQINFNMEARGGDTVDLWSYHSGDGSFHFVEGRRGEQNLFQCISSF